MGLQGGTDMYSYVGGNPLSSSDPAGLLTVAGVYAGGVCILGSGAKALYELHEVNVALEAANKAFEEMKKLEEEKRACNDPARKAGIDQQISALKRQRAASMVKVTASGFTAGTFVLIGVVVCPAVAALF